MAPTPTTSALGALGEVARPAPARPAARPDDHAEKSSFSDALQEARSERPEPPREPSERETKPARSEKTEAKEPIARSAEPVEPTRKPAAAAASTGKDLPPAGDTLPADADASADASALPSLDDLLAKMLGTAKDDAKPAESSGSDDKKATADAAAVVTAVAAPVVAPALPVMPENPAAAAAALAARSGQQPPAEDGQGELRGVADATQKRAVPTAAQTLSDIAASLSGKPAETSSTAPAQTAADTAPDAGTAPQPDGLDGLKLAAHIQRTAHGTDAQTSDKPTTDSGSAAIAPETLTQNAEPASDSDRSSFRDTLKQIDATLTPGKSDAPAVAAVPRDNGLRQYLDGSANAAKVDIPVGKPGWSDAVAGKVMWMSSQNLSSAEIQMNPPDLGPLSVRVTRMRRCAKRSISRCRVCARCSAIRAFNYSIPASAGRARCASSARSRSSRATATAAAAVAVVAMARSRRRPKSAACAVP
ncbi:conserved hypothetical protein [Ricinus communis]|uniref:Flagellar hook-length control protein FliK n=1 Tax=Ricinus communis TaxID=3988 RepID=B9T9Y0_RICCO|nr:conserved hypothetical protein [Ricinus communis]